MTSTSEVHGEAHGAPTSLRVIVKYAAAAKPFQDDAANPAETVGSLKARVLSAFNLQEGSLPDGNVVSYKLYRGKDEVADMSASLGSLAGQSHALELKLSQFITQGGKHYAGRESAPSGAFLARWPRS